MLSGCNGLFFHPFCQGLPHSCFLKPRDSPDCLAGPKLVDIISRFMSTYSNSTRKYQNSLRNSQDFFLGIGDLPKTGGCRASKEKQSHIQPPARPHPRHTESSAHLAAFGLVDQVEPPGHPATGPKKTSGSLWFRKK